MTSFMEFMCCDCRVWLEGVLPRVMDREGSVQEKCLEMLEDVIISNIAPLQRYVILASTLF